MKDFPRPARDSELLGKSAQDVYGAITPAAIRESGSAESKIKHWHEFYAWLSVCGHQCFVDNRVPIGNDWEHATGVSEFKNLI